jgi:2-haloacid dehalogenase
MINIKALMFDAWGTLFDVENDCVALTAATVVKDESLTISVEGFLEVWKHFYHALERGPRFHTIRDANILSLRMAFDRLNVHGDAERYVDVLFGLWENSSTYPEVPKVLKDIRHFRKCIVSNSDVDMLKSVLKKNRLNGVFEFLVTSESTKAYKPSPKIFRKATEMSGCTSSELLHIGDSQHEDIFGAKKLGISAVWVNRKGEKLREGIPEPEYEIKDLRGLPGILGMM